MWCEGEAVLVNESVAAFRTGRQAVKFWRERAQHVMDTEGESYEMPVLGLKLCAN